MSTVDLLAAVLSNLYPSGMLSREAADLAMREVRSASEGTLPRAFVCLETPDASIAAVRAALALRVPVYFGKPQGKLYNNLALKMILGYTTAQALRMANGAPGSVRLAVAGPLHHMPNHPLVWCVHAYAPNLESASTRDYHTIVDDTGRLRESVYKERCNQLMENLRACAHEALRRSGASYVRANVFMPAMGVGAYLSQLGVADAAKAMELCAHAVAEEWASAARYGVHLHLCMFDPQAYAVFAQLPLKMLGITLHGPHGPGNLFNKLDAYVRAGDGTLPIFINAWDDRAFVGNGGINDNSVDGFFVGGYGPNRNFVNGSYAHNVILQPHLLKSRGWVTVDKVLQGRPPPQLRPVSFSEFRNAVATSLELFNDDGSCE